MSRWAETAIILSVGVVVTVGLMLFARWRTPEVENPQAILDRIGLESTHSAIESPPGPPSSEVKSGEQPVTAVGDESASDTSALGQGPSIRVPPHPAIDVPDETPPEKTQEEILKVLEDIPTVRPSAPIDETKDRALDTSKDTPSEEEDDKEQEEAVPVKAKAVDPIADSRRELQVLKDARQSLHRLHQLLLRPDVSRASSQQEADRLTTLLKQLPEDLQKEVRAWVKEGYDRRVQRASRRDGLSDRSAQGVGLEESTLGKRDDTPSDLRALDQRIRRLRVQLGTKRSGSNAGTAPSGVQPQSIGVGVKTVNP